MNAWAGLILWGEAVGDRAVRDLGVYLYTTEMAAINEYWFDVRGENRPAAYTPSVVTLVWGGKGVNETWFTRNPEAVHGINWLPIHGGSLYLGQFPAYVEKNYAALVAENRGTPWDEWADLVWMYRALSDPRDAHEAVGSGGRQGPHRGGQQPGQHLSLDRQPGEAGTGGRDGHGRRAARGGLPPGPHAARTCVYSLADRPRTVRFSDGHHVDVKGKGFTISRRDDDQEQGHR